MGLSGSTIGTPGAVYARPRHNVGFWVVDAFAAQEGVALGSSSRGALWGRLESDTLGEVFLAKPQRYMNRSGRPLRDLLADWEVSVEDAIVVHDDVDLAPGRLKLKRGGGAGGHRGLLSIEAETGSRDFCRLRFGVGRPPPGGETSEYVLEPIGAGAGPMLAAAVERAVDGLRGWLCLDFQAAVKNVNTAPETPVEPGGAGC